MTDQLVRSRNVLDLRPGDVVRERNADWPEPFTAGEFYDYTAAEIIRVNTTTVHVAIVTDGFPAAVPQPRPVGDRRRGGEGIPMTPDCMSEGAVTMATQEETMTAAENGPREWATRMLAPGHAVILDTVICARVCLTIF